MLFSKNALVFVAAAFAVVSAAPASQRQQQHHNNHTQTHHHQHQQHQQPALIDIDILRRTAQPEPNAWATTGDLIRLPPSIAGRVQLQGQDAHIRPRNYVATSADVKVGNGNGNARTRLSITKPKSGQQKQKGWWSSKNKNKNGNNGQQQNGYDGETYDGNYNSYAVNVNGASRQQQQQQQQGQSTVVYYQPVAVQPQHHGLLDLDLNLKRDAPELASDVVDTARSGFAAHGANSISSKITENAPVKANDLLGDDFIFGGPVRQGLARLPLDILGSNDKEKLSAPSAAAAESTSSSSTSASVTSTSSTTSASSTATASPAAASVVVPHNGGSLIDLDLGILKRDAADLFIVPDAKMKLAEAINAVHTPVSSLNADSPVAAKDADSTSTIESTSQSESTPTQTSSEPQPTASEQAAAVKIPIAPSSVTSHTSALPVQPSSLPVQPLADAAPAPVAAAADFAESQASSDFNGERRPTVADSGAMLQAAVLKDVNNKNKVTPWVAPVNFANAPGLHTFTQL